MEANYSCYKDWSALRSNWRVHHRDLQADSCHVWWPSCTWSVATIAKVDLLEVVWNAVVTNVDHLEDQIQHRHATRLSRSASRVEAKFHERFLDWHRRLLAGKPRRLQYGIRKVQDYRSTTLVWYPIWTSAICFTSRRRHPRCRSSWINQIGNQNFYIFGGKRRCEKVFVINIIS